MEWTWEEGTEATEGSWEGGTEDMEGAWEGGTEDIEGTWEGGTDGGKPGGGEGREGEGKGSGYAETWDLGEWKTLGRMGGSEGSLRDVLKGRKEGIPSEQDKGDASER